MNIEFVPIDYDYFDFEGRNYIQLIGRTEKGKKICVVDSYEPNFWVILEKGTSKKRIEKIVSKIEKIEVKKNSRVSKVLKTEVSSKKYLGNDVQAIRVFVTNSKDAHDIASEIGDVKEIVGRREYDLPIITKYIKERDVEPLIWQSVGGDIIAGSEFGGIGQSLDVDICIKAKKISRLKEKREFVPRILAYDIETNDAELGKGEILMISLYGKDFKKVFTWKKCSGAQNYVNCYSDEGEMLEAFAESVRNQDADMLVGYFSDGFDLPYLKARAQENGLTLSLGVDGKNPSFKRGRIPSGKIVGLVHVDIYRFVEAVFSQYLQSETLSLNEVASELVDEKKEDFDFDKLPHMNDSDWRDFFSYNLQDSKATYKLAEKLWPDMLEFSKIIKEPLYDITRDRMSSHVENYILHNLDRFDEIAEKRPVHEEIGRRRSREKYEGAFVFEPSPGLYEKIVMFDFTSFWPSIIVSYNLSKSTNLEKKEGGSLEVDLGKGKKAYFKKGLGFFPEMLGEIIELRKKYKKEYLKNKSNLLKARSNAYKLLANASYGYQGFFGARYYCPEASASATAISRDFIHSTIDKIENQGHRILGSDTDSIIFLQADKTKKQVLDFLKKLNSELPGIMELDLEDFYSRGLFVSKRSKSAGAKKKYALLGEDGKLKIRGFETVRRDWCKLSRELQSNILKMILEEGNEKSALDYLKKVITKLKGRKIDLEDLMIRTQLKKPLNEYLSEGPHVVAAKKMEEKDISISPGMLIKYFVGENGGRGKRVGDRVYLPDEKAEYDIDYYLDNQILPAVENIFDVFGINVSEVVAGESQQKLF